MRKRMRNVLVAPCLAGQARLDYIEHSRRCGTTSGMHPQRQCCTGTRRWSWSTRGGSTPSSPPLIRFAAFGLPLLQLRRRAEQQQDVPAPPERDVGGASSTATTSTFTSRWRWSGPNPRCSSQSRRPWHRHLNLHKRWRRGSGPNPSGRRTTCSSPSRRPWHWRSRGSPRSPVPTLAGTYPNCECSTCRLLGFGFLVFINYVKFEQIMYPFNCNVSYFQFKMLFQRIVLAPRLGSTGANTHNFVRATPIELIRAPIRTLYWRPVWRCSNSRWC